MTIGSSEVSSLSVLTVEAVQAGIEALQSQRIHEQFPAYLHLRQLAVAANSFANIEPVWHEVGDLLRMPGGPPTKPHYRPFSSRNRKDPSGYWLNENLAGSYAPRSIRSTSRFMLNAAGDGFELPSDHAHQALAVLLKGIKVPAWALAAYYLRNYGFILHGEGGVEDLISSFKREFLLDQGTDFATLFDNGHPPLLVGEWFEPLTLGSEEGAEAEDA